MTNDMIMVFGVVQVTVDKERSCYKKQKGGEKQADRNVK